jgi:short-subunit dehydrogenase
MNDENDKNFIPKKALIIGASRGLGRSISLFLTTHFDSVEEVTLVARRQDLLNEVEKEISPKIRINTQKCDLSRSEDQGSLVALLAKEDFDLIIYVAGGGPHGEYGAKEWKDHHWALQVGLMAPMRLVHEWLKNREVQKLKSGAKFIIVGSRIAEQSPDPLATSYAASKHGLVGFVSSLQKELEGQTHKVWLFSPGYIDTEMLPKSAHVRHDGSKLMSADTAAQACLRWIKKEGPWHRVLN